MRLAGDVETEAAGGVVEALGRADAQRPVDLDVPAVAYPHACPPAGRWIILCSRYAPNPSGPNSRPSPEFL